MAVEESTIEEHRELCTDIAQRIAEPVLELYKREDIDIAPGARVLVVLNALASVAGMVLAGTDIDPVAVEFFNQAVAQQAIGQMMKREPDGEPSTEH